MCTVEEVVGEWIPNAQEQAWNEAYERAVANFPEDAELDFNAILAEVRQGGGFTDSPEGLRPGDRPRSVTLNRTLVPGWTLRDGSPQSLPLPNPPTLAEVVDRLAPVTDPDRFYSDPNSRLVADWLRSTGAQPVSVREFKKSVTPDAALLDRGVTVEFKTIANGTFLSAMDAVAKAIVQARHVVVHSRVAITQRDAENITRGALERYGQALDELVVTFDEGGGYVVWNP